MYSNPSANLKYLSSYPPSSREGLAASILENIRVKLSILILLASAVLGLTQAGNAFEGVVQQSSPCHIEAQPWAEADKIFRSDRRWLGGDGAASVDLGKGRVLWLFGDSLIDLSGSRSRQRAVLVRNSIAVQAGYHPAGATMGFSWKMKDAHPFDFFPPTGDHWFWPASGIMIGRRLLIFLMEVETAANGLGFETCGWKAVLIDKAQEIPDRWELTFLKSPQKQGLIVGSGNPVLENGFLYVFAADPEDRAVYLVRWPERSAFTGALLRPQWWAGDGSGWTGPEDKGVKPLRLMAGAQMEFSVQYVPRLKSYLQIQTLSLMNPCLAVRTAPALTGPWSSPVCFFTPSEQGGPDLLIYAGKSHPGLRGAELIFTYVVNSTSQDRLLNDMSIYFPVMLRGRIRANGSLPQDRSP